MIGLIARRVRRRDEGITLVELVVSTMLGLMIMVTAGALLISSTQVSSIQAKSDVNARGASTAMNAMSRYLHAATTYPTSGGTQAAFVGSMGTSDVTFYAYVNLVSTAAQPVKVHYYVDSTTKMLFEQLYSSTYNAATGYWTFSNTPTTVNLGGPVATPLSDGTPLFVYLDGAGNTTTDPFAVQSVQVSLEYGSSKAGTAGDTYLTTTVALLNVGQFGGTSS